MISAAFNQAKDNILENVSTTFSAVVTTSFSLIILGTFILVYLNLIHLTQITFQKSNYSIFLTESIATKSYFKILNHIQRKIPGVDKVKEISSEEARQQLVDSFGEAKEMLNKLDFPKFPRIIEFVLNRPESLTKSEIVAIQTLEGVQEIITGRDTRDQIDIFFNLANFVGLFLTVLLIVSIILIIHSSIQISIRIRIKEIEILKILGATRGFIRLPYIVEGMLIAFISYLLSLGIIYLLFQFVVAGITYNDATFAIKAIVRYFTGIELVYAFLVIFLAGIFSSFIASNKVINQLDAIGPDYVSIALHA